MTDTEWLEVYDKMAEEIDDDILDDADERFKIGVEPGQRMSCNDEYYIYCAKRWVSRYE